MNQKNEPTIDDDPNGEEEPIDQEFQKMYVESEEPKSDSESEEPKNPKSKIFEQIGQQSYFKIIFLAITNIILLTIFVYIAQWIFFEGTVIWIEMIYFIILAAIFWFYQSMLSIKRNGDVDGSSNTFVTWITLVPFVVCFVGLFILNSQFPYWKIGLALWIRFVGNLLGNSDTYLMSRVFKQSPVFDPQELVDAALGTIDPKTSISAVSATQPIDIHLDMDGLHRIGYVPCSMFDEWIENEKMKGNVYTQHEVYKVLGEEYSVKEAIHDLHRNICLVDLLSWMSGVGSLAVVLFLAIFVGANQPFLRRLFDRVRDRYTSEKKATTSTASATGKGLVEKFKKEVEQSAEESRLYSALKTL